MKFESARCPLARELAALDKADPVLAGDRAAEPHGKLEEVAGRLRRADKLVLVDG